MCQERRDTADGKIYVPWTMFASEGKENRWRQMEPDGPLPFWKPAKRRQLGNIMVHEGAKTAQFVDCLINDATKRAERRKHPWANELAGYEHWGAIGGALAIHRCDYDELHREKIEGHVVYVCDNDGPGKEAVRTFSRMYGGLLYAIRFDDRFKQGWDLADPLPDCLYSKVGTVSSRLLAMAEAATWATVIVERHGPGRPGHALSKHFQSEWCHTVNPEKYSHTRLTQYAFVTEAQFNNYVRPFSHIDNTARLLKESYHNKAVTIKYDPSRAPGIFF